MSASDSLISRVVEKLGLRGRMKFKDITYDSRKVVPGSCFVAIRGEHADGHDYINDAVKNGATVIVSDHPVQLPAGVKNLVVDDTRVALAKMSSEHFGEPSRDMRVIGVTGTNGKTTVTYLLESVLKKIGRSTGVIGTVSWRYDGRELGAPNTTPMSYDLQKLLSDMRQSSVTDVVMEVSSHALVQHRVEAVDFDAAIFTNLTHDHLDYHRTMEEYFEAKRRFFSVLMPSSTKRKKVFAINADDAYGRRIAGSPLHNDIGLVTYGFAKDAGVSVTALESSVRGNIIGIITPWGELEIRSRLCGRFNVSNIMAVVASLGGLGIGLQDIKTGIEEVECVPGRLEEVRNDLGITVFVDYAHTPDALRNVLTTIREISSGRLITVFGCGGDRDRTKRPLMGEVAAGLSDTVIITSDNPRTEDPLKIIGDIVPAVRASGARYLVEPDRKKAISEAFRDAGKGDVILVAGKGHENYQIIGDERTHFDDREEIRKVLQR